MINNKQLVAFVSKAFDEKWGYVWGTFGQLLTADLLTQKIRQYPGPVGTYAEFIQKNWVGRKTADCVGLIKSAYWSESGNLRYDQRTDVSADGMFDMAKEKGPIDTLPEIPGICVWKNGHIGVYIGDGIIIEAHGTKYGVIATKVNETGFTHWLKCPYVEYPAIQQSKWDLPGDFVERIYLELNPDVAYAVANGLYGLKSGAQHYIEQGRAEGRPYKREQVKKYYVITRYLPSTEYGIEIVGLIAKYFPEAQRLYMDHDGAGQWIATQYFDKVTAEKVADRLKADNLLSELKEE